MEIKQSGYPGSRNPHSVAVGQAFERFIESEFHRRGWDYTPCETRDDQLRYGDALEGIEVKFDDRCSTTGRIAIEVAERTALTRPWTASGIYASSDATLYVQGNYHVVYVFRRADLRDYFESEKPDTINDNPNTVEKFYLSLRDAKALSIATIVPQYPWGRSDAGVWTELTDYGVRP